MLKTHLKNAIAALTALSIVLALGCRSRHTPQVLVVILDLTASTDSDGRAVAFESLQRWFNQKMIRRGDKIVVIPITGDALTETQGKILRFEISQNRATYDEDLRSLATKVHDSLEKMEQEAREN